MLVTKWGPTFSVRRPNSYLRLFPFYFDPANSTFLAKLYVDQNCTSRLIRSPDLTRGRSKIIEVKGSKYTKGRAVPNCYECQICETNTVKNITKAGHVKVTITGHFLAYCF